MAAMTSEVCLAWFRFTEPSLAKDVLSGPKTSVNTPIQKHMLHTAANTHRVSHINSHMLLTEDMGSAVIVNLSSLFYHTGPPTHSSDEKNLTLEADKEWKEKNGNPQGFMTIVLLTALTT